LALLRFLFSADLDLEEPWHLFLDETPAATQDPDRQSVGGRLELLAIVAYPFESLVSHGDLSQ
jgi:hypothetical protein